MGLTQSIPASPNLLPICNLPKSEKPAILDFTDTKYREAQLKLAILSNESDKNIIALLGVPGSGKTTILKALAHDPVIQDTFCDGVWYIFLTQRMSLLYLLQQLERLVQRMFPDWRDEFLRLAALPSTHPQLVEKLVSKLSSKRFLLIVDDIPNSMHGVHQTIADIFEYVQYSNSNSLKLLVSSPFAGYGQTWLYDVCLELPSHPDIQRQEDIFYFHASPNYPTWYFQTKPLTTILKHYGGIPFTVALVSACIRKLNTEVREADRAEELAADFRFRDRRIARSRSEESFVPLDVALDILARSWDIEIITLREVYRSLCVLQQHALIPLNVLERLWGVSSKDATSVSEKLSGLNLCSVEEYDNIPHVKIHDLVMAHCCHEANEEEGIPHWHGRLTDAYCKREKHEAMKNSIPTFRAWWTMQLPEVEKKYMIDNLIHHLLAADNTEEALWLLTEYRWIMFVNEQEGYVAFQKIIYDLRLLISVVMKNQGKEDRIVSLSLLSDLEVLANTMEMCMVPFCIDNPEECTFQLYGRLSSLDSTSAIIQHLIWSIESFAHYPWVRPASGVLKSAERVLKRTLQTPYPVLSLQLGAVVDELLVGTAEELQKINSKHGAEVESFVSHDTWKLRPCVDPLTKQIYACSRRGLVTEWQRSTVQSKMIVQSGVHIPLSEDEKITCMELFPGGMLVLGSNYGRFWGVAHGTAKRIMESKGHSRRVTSLTKGQSGKLLVSGSLDESVRLYDMESMKEIASLSHRDMEGVNCVALSPDERVIAAASSDGRVHLWDAHKLTKLCTTTATGRSRGKMCVLFGNSNHLLYVGSSERIEVWDVSCPHNGMRLVHMYEDVRMKGDSLLQISGDDEELFASTRGSKCVLVWRAKPRLGGGQGEGVATLGRGVKEFGVSKDGSRMVMYKERDWVVEVRGAEDVMNGVDKVEWRMSIGRERGVRGVGVSNDGEVVVYWRGGEAGDEIFVVSEAGTEMKYKRSGDEVKAVGIECVRKGEDGSVRVEAVIWGREGGDGRGRAVEILWGGGEEEAVERSVERGGGVSDDVELSCRRGGDGEYTRSIEYWDGTESRHVGTLEKEPVDAVYVGERGRLWVLCSEGRMEYVEVMRKENESELKKNAPPFPVISRPCAMASKMSSAKPEYSVFISHAGPDKHTIAKVLWNELEKMDISAYLDMKADGNIADFMEEMDLAMKTARIAVVILSPEFAARKWTMRELISFWERWEKEGNIIIIPVFYRMSVLDLSGVANVLGMVDEEGNNVFEKEGVLKRFANEGGPMKEIFDVLMNLRSITGIENNEGASNKEGEREEEKRKRYVARISSAVVEAMGRLDM